MATGTYDSCTRRVKTQKSMGMKQNITYEFINEKISYPSGRTGTGMGS
jgi:hypothetical protein